MGKFRQAKDWYLAEKYFLNNENEPLFRPKETNLCLFSALIK